HPSHVLGWAGQLRGGAICAALLAVALEQRALHDAFPGPWLRDANPARSRAARGAARESILPHALLSTCCDHRRRDHAPLEAVLRGIAKRTTEPDRPDLRARPGLLRPAPPSGPGRLAGRSAPRHGGRDRPAHLGR